MNDHFTAHMTESELLDYCEAGMSAEQMAAADQHLLACRDCAQRVEHCRAEVQDVLHELHSIKLSSPAPPRPWMDIRQSLEQIDRESRKPARSGNAVRWGALAAGVLIAIAAITLNSGRTLNAAELLDRAVKSPAAQQKRGHIQIKTKKRSLVRFARIEPGRTQDSASDLREMFERAKFSWEDPLSARSFAAWRSQLSSREDQVSTWTSKPENLRYYVIRTSTADGPLTEASLTLRASDLHPVSERLRFESGTVEISELIEAPPAPRTNIAEVPRPADSLVSSGATAVGPGEELQVLAALNRIGADLGEPVEVTRSSAGITVVGAGLDPARQQQIRSALSGLEGVQLSFVDPQKLETKEEREVSPSISATSRASIQSLLESKLPAGTNVETFIDRVLRDMDLLLARAHALKNLAERFSSVIEAKLTPEDKQLLHNLSGQHAAALRSSSSQLAARLDPVLGISPSSDSQACTGWQACAASLLVHAQRLDGQVTVAFAGTGHEAPPGIAVLQSSLATVRSDIEQLIRSRE